MCCLIICISVYCIFFLLFRNNSKKFLSLLMLLLIFRINKIIFLIFVCNFKNYFSIKKVHFSYIRKKWQSRISFKFCFKYSSKTNLFNNDTSICHFMKEIYFCHLPVTISILNISKQCNYFYLEYNYQNIFFKTIFLYF